MAIQPYLVRRKMRAAGKGGRTQWRYQVRWRDPATGKTKSESCATGDKTQAETFLKLKWQQLNGLAPAADQPSAEPEQSLPAWDECRDAARKAMRADNLRASYIADAILLFDGLQKMFPALKSPAFVTHDMANDYKRRRSEQGNSPWTVRGDLSTLKALFGKWLGKECGLLKANPFADVKAPRCDDPDIRIVSTAEIATILEWIEQRWGGWQLPQVYLQVAALIGWRATEIASMREDDLLPDGYVRIIAGSSKTRKHKYGWLPDSLYSELRSCGANGWAFGRFSDELRRRLILCHKKPNHAAMVKDFTPSRLVGWMQDELQRFNHDQAESAKEAGISWSSFTLHDFRRTAITSLQMSGASEKEASLMVGATPEVIRRHYEKMDQQLVARRIVQQRLGGGNATVEFPAGQSRAANVPQAKIEANRGAKKQRKSM